MKIWKFIKDHWKLAAVAILVVVALLMGRRLVNLVPSWIRRLTGIQDSAPQPQDFRVVDSSHVIARTDKGWEVVETMDAKGQGVPATKVTSIHVDDANVIIGTAVPKGG